jgi:hypothetical protein
MELVAAIYASAFQGRTIRRCELTPSSPFYGSMDGDGRALNSLGDDAVIGLAAASPAETITGSDGARR